MLIKALGAIDIIAGLILIFSSQIKFPYQILLLFGIILLAKSFLGMFKEFGSWIDLTTGLALMTSIIFNFPLIISIILGFLVIQKGVVSFF